MELILGFLLATLLFGCSIGGFLIGRVSHKDNKNEQKKLDEEVKREQLKQIRGMNNVLSYDVEVAMGVREQHE